MSRFKLLEHGSRIDIVFVCVFFLLLVPASKISREEKSVQENRRLAAYVPLFSDQGLNNRFGQDFEAWFNDRFNYREAVISFYSGLEMLKQPYQQQGRFFQQRPIGSLTTNS